MIHILTATNPGPVVGEPPIANAGDLRTFPYYRQFVQVGPISKHNGVHEEVFRTRRLEEPITRSLFSLLFDSSMDFNGVFKIVFADIDVLRARPAWRSVEHCSNFDKPDRRMCVWKCSGVSRLDMAFVAYQCS